MTNGSEWSNDRLIARPNVTYDVYRHKDGLIIIIAIMMDFYLLYLYITVDYTHNIENVECFSKCI